MARSHLEAAFEVVTAGQIAVLVLFIDISADPGYSTSTLSPRFMDHTADHSCRTGPEVWVMAVCRLHMPDFD